MSEGKFVFGPEFIGEWKRWIVFDAQTSGGLILSIPEKDTDRLLGRLHTEGVKEAAVIGLVVGEPKGEIAVGLSKNSREK